jgi:hypothetical protein
MSLPSTRYFVLIGILLPSLLLAACQTQDAPARAVEDYLQALVDKDADRVVSLSCAGWEEQATMEVDSFEAVTPTLKDASCKTAEADGDNQIVSCTGSIAVTYNDEQQELNLDRHQYVVAFEGGEWRMCGYK